MVETTFNVGFCRSLSVNTVVFMLDAFMKLLQRSGEGRQPKAKRSVGASAEGEAKRWGEGKKGEN
jgi:hypothetical protein